MKKFFTLLLCFISIIWTGNKAIAADKTVNSITISQWDTFALRAFPAQPVLKININVAGTDGNLNLQRLRINFDVESYSDIDSICIYRTGSHNRFSMADYPGEATLLGQRKKIAGDSIVLDNLSHPLDPGDNYFWVTMDLSQSSFASHYLDVSVPANGITIGGSLYPSIDQDPPGTVGIVAVYFRDNFESLMADNLPVGWTQEPSDHDKLFKFRKKKGDIP